MSFYAATATPDAATHSHIVDVLVGLIPAAVLLLVIVAAGYLTVCWLFPFTICPHPELRYGAQDAWRVQQWRAMRCRRCEGTGTRLRTGRRLINHIRTTRRHH